jgi:hypothetical protein
VKFTNNRNSLNFLLNNNVDEAEISVYGYKCYRKDRCVVKNARQGGVMLFAKEDIVSNECLELNVIGAVWCKIKTIRNRGIVQWWLGVCRKIQAAETTS